MTVREAAPRGAAGDHPVEIVYYTDPLCCWSWAMEPHWRRLQMAFEGHPGITWRVRMAGMIPDWARYRDPVHDVAAPAHMGAYWYQVRREGQLPLDERLWVDDPPSSSHPACLAYYAAQAQGASTGERYLRRLREAAMLERRNIAQPAVLAALARELAMQELPRFDPAVFLGALHDPAVAGAFREDLREARWLEITRFPAVVLRRPRGHRAILILGHRRFDVLHAAVVEMLGRDEQRSPSPPDAVGYLERWSSATRWEIATAVELDPAACEERLTADAGLVDRILRRDLAHADDVLLRIAPGWASRVAHDGDPARTC